MLQKNFKWFRRVSFKRPEILLFHFTCNQILYIISPASVQNFSRTPFVSRLGYLVPLRWKVVAMQFHISPLWPALAAYHKTSGAINCRYKSRPVSARGLIIRRLRAAVLRAGNRSLTIAADFSFLWHDRDCALASTTLNDTRNYLYVNCNERLEVAGNIGRASKIM